MRKKRDADQHKSETQQEIERRLKPYCDDAPQQHGDHRRTCKHDTLPQRPIIILG